MGKPLAYWAGCSHGCASPLDCEAVRWLEADLNRLDQELNYVDPMEWVNFTSCVDEGMPVAGVYPGEYRQPMFQFKDDEEDGCWHSPATWYGEEKPQAQPDGVPGARSLGMLGMRSDLYIVDEAYVQARPPSPTWEDIRRLYDRPVEAVQFDPGAYIREAVMSAALPLRRVTFDPDGMYRVPGCGCPSCWPYRNG